MSGISTARSRASSATGGSIGKFKNVLIVVILLVMLVLIVFGEILHHTQFALGVSFKNLLTFSMGITVVLFGVWEMHYNKMATRELLWQYRNQLSHFSRASTQLSLTYRLGQAQADHCRARQGFADGELPVDDPSLPSRARAARDDLRPEPAATRCSKNPLCDSARHYV